MRLHSNKRLRVSQNTFAKRENHSTGLRLLRNRDQSWAPRLLPEHHPSPLALAEMVSALQLHNTYCHLLATPTEVLEDQPLPARAGTCRALDRPCQSWELHPGTEVPE